MNVLSPLKKILDFIVYSNLFIAAGVACFTLQTAVLFPAFNPVLEAFAVLNFITTFILYNLQRLYYASHENLENKYSWYTRNRHLIFTLMILLLMCFFTRLLNFFLGHTDYLIAYLILGILSIFYFSPPLQLRKYGMLKPFIIALVFVSTSILVPLYRELNPSVLIYSFGQFCFIAALCVLFDVKDMKHDRRLNLATIPVQLGLKKTKWVNVVLVVLYLFTAFINQQFILTYFIIAAITLLLTFLLKPGRHIYFYFFMVDGLILVQYFLINS